MEEQNNKKHHFLVAGQVIFTMGKSLEPGAVTINSVVIQDAAHVSQQTLAKAELGVRQQFLGKMGDNPVQIRDITLLTVSPMGLMSKDEFFDRKPPTDAEVSQELKDAGAQVQ